MPRPEATLELTDKHLRIETDSATTEAAWDLVQDLWQFPEFWLLFFSRAHFVTLPVADMDEAMRAAILARTNRRK
jgi:hypothetical protein